MADLIRQVLGWEAVDTPISFGETAATAELSTAARGKTETGSLHLTSTLRRTTGPSPKVGCALELATRQDPPDERSSTSGPSANRTVEFRCQVHSSPTSSPRGSLLGRSRRYSRRSRRSKGNGAGAARAWACGRRRGVGGRDRGGPDRLDADVDSRVGCTGRTDRGVHRRDPGRDRRDGGRGDPTGSIGPSIASGPSAALLHPAPSRVPGERDRREAPPVVDCLSGHAGFTGAPGTLRLRNVLARGITFVSWLLSRWPDRSSAHSWRRAVSGDPHSSTR